MSTIETFLTDHHIPFEKFEHPAVFTCEESELLAPEMPGADTKNLFLRDGKGKRHFLVVVGHEKRVDLKALRTLLNADKLSFGSVEKLLEFLGVTPGSATVLGLVTDANNEVEVIFDLSIWKADAIQCHPMVNTATLVIAHRGLEDFLLAVKHSYRVMEIPAMPTL